MIKYFVLAFVILFVLIVLMPELVDHVMQLFSELLLPGYDSVIVFKDLAERRELVMNFIRIIKKLTNFM